ncbi:MAG TPA: hypothetical protein VGF98_01150 [Candidatus Tumulicola sp.]|jgi:hypothetical protein
MVYPHKDSPTGAVPVGAVILTEIQIPFWNLVGLLVKVSLAAIPASIILFVIYGVLWAVTLGLFGAGLFGTFHR